MSQIKVAVYGTLKQGFSNHRVMQYAGGKKIGEEVLSGATMFSYGAFPVIALDCSENNILVEVYEVEDLEPLDRLEGFPNFYDRSKVETKWGSAWIYHAPSREVDHINATLPRVESGIW